MKNSLHLFPFVFQSILKIKYLIIKCNVNKIDITTCGPFEVFAFEKETTCGPFEVFVSKKEMYAQMSSFNIED